MSWRERMAPATFRGVPFHVESSERTGGRRGVTHEYPLRDKPFREDLGRQVRGFTVEGYVIGDDYLDQKEALLTALETDGPGVLVHPYYGTKTVAVLGVRVRESRQDGGMATFSIEFQETEETPSQPVAAPDNAGVLVTRATAARAAAETQFAERYAPGIHTASLSAMVGAVADAVGDAVETGAELTRALDELVANAATLVTDADALFTALSDLFDLIEGDAIDVYEFDPGQRPSANTESREIEQTNFDALQDVIQLLAVIRAAELAGEETFESYDAATATRDTITDALDEQMETATDDAFPALSDLRAAVVAAVPGLDSDLPRLTTYTPAESIPSLVLSWELYGNVTGEADIIARNGVKHPAFVLGGRELEVLSDA